eukprot:984459-Pyramimonas_sp.AAC.1
MGCSPVGRENEQWPEDLARIERTCVSSVQDPTDKIITPKETAWVPGKMARESPNCQEVVV